VKYEDIKSPENRTMGALSCLCILEWRISRVCWWRLASVETRSPVYCYVLEVLAASIFKVGQEEWTVWKSVALYSSKLVEEFVSLMEDDSGLSATGKEGVS